MNQDLTQSQMASADLPFIRMTALYRDGSWQERHPRSHAWWL